MLKVLITLAKMVVATSHSNTKDRAQTKKCKLTNNPVSSLNLAPIANINLLVITNLIHGTMKVRVVAAAVVTTSRTLIAIESAILDNNNNINK